MVLHALSKNENSRANHFEITNTLMERGLTIKALETSREEKGRIEREDALEIASLTVSLEEEQETLGSLQFGCGCVPQALWCKGSGFGL